MRLATKFIIFSVLTFILKLVSVCTPEWSIFTVLSSTYPHLSTKMLQAADDNDAARNFDRKDKDGYDVDGLHHKVSTTDHNTLGHRLPDVDPPAIDSSSSESSSLSQESESDETYLGNNSKTRLVHQSHRHQQYHGQGDSLCNGRPGASVRHGLWMSVKCAIRSFEGGNEWRSCQYDTNKNDIEMLSRYLTDKDSQNNLFRAMDQFAVLEFQVETTIGLIVFVLATVTQTAFLKGFIQKKAFGYLACLFFFLSGILFWITVGKTFMMISDTVFQLSKISDVHFDIEVPWSAVIGGIGGIMSLGISLVFLYTIASNYTEWKKLIYDESGKVYSKCKDNWETEMKVVSPPSYAVTDEKSAK